MKGPIGQRHLVHLQHQHHQYQFQSIQSTKVRCIKPSSNNNNHITTRSTTVVATRQPPLPTRHWSLISSSSLDSSKQQQQQQISVLLAEWRVHCVISHDLCSLLSLVDERTPIKSKSVITRDRWDMQSRPFFVFSSFMSVCLLLSNNQRPNKGRWRETASLLLTLLVCCCCCWWCHSSNLKRLRPVRAMHVATTVLIFVRWPRLANLHNYVILKINFYYLCVSGEAVPASKN